MAHRNDLIIVNFSSWLPGDGQILTSSLFATIAKRLKSRYIISGLAKQLKQFARLLAGTVPKVGETLKQFFEEPSQVEQLSSLKSLLSGLPVRIVVLVDELDRMDGAELHLLLEAIRGVVDLPNITYVCAFDKNAAVRLINENDILYGQFYLEKFSPPISSGASGRWAGMGLSFSQRHARRSRQRPPSSSSSRCERNRVGHRGLA